jgi:hypothetical protein
MFLLLYYVGLVIVGDFGVYLVGMGVERMWGSQASLWAFLALYFIVLWVAWVIAVWLSQPKVLQPQAL